MANASVTVTLKTDVVRARLRQGIFRAIQRVFELDTKARAKELSPVSDTWPSIPASRGEKRIDHGLNRASIDTDIVEVDAGVQATIFTQSGYGGYLESGTSKMPARPYLAPAVQQTAKNIPAEVRKETNG